MSISLNTLVVRSDDTSESLSPECVEEGKLRDELFNKKVMEDIINSFRLDIDDTYEKFTIRDIEAAHLAYGGKENDQYYHTLSGLFKNIKASTRGTPRLFVRPYHAYFLYKETSNTNVMVYLTLKNDHWVVVEEKKVAGNIIEYEQLKCEKKYFQKRKNSSNTNWIRSKLFSVFVKQNLYDLKSI